MSISDAMTPLMDKVRQITGLTGKISIAQLTDLMDNFVSPNLIPDTSENWQNCGNMWRKTLCDALPVSKGETISIGSEFRNCSGRFSLGVLCLDADKNMLSPSLDKDGNFPLSTGNIANSYIIEDAGYTNSSSSRELTITIQANNCKYINIFISGWDDTGTLDYRKVMAVKGPRLLPWTPLYIEGDSSTQPTQSAASSATEGA